MFAPSSSFLSSAVRNETFLGAAAAADTNTTTTTNVSTTKALLLSLTVPRIHLVYVPPKQIRSKLSSSSSSVKGGNSSTAKQTKDDDDDDDKNNSNGKYDDDNGENHKTTNKEGKMVDWEKTTTLTSSSIKEEEEEEQEDEVIVVVGNNNDDDDDDEKFKKGTVLVDSSETAKTISSATTSATATATVTTTTTTTTATTTSIQTTATPNMDNIINNMDVMEPEEDIEEEIGYVQSDSQDLTKDVVVEHVVTKEEMSAIVKLDETNTEEEENNEQEKDKKRMATTTTTSEKEPNEQTGDDEANEGGDEENDDKASSSRQQHHAKTPSAIDSTMSNLKDMIFAVMNGGDDDNGLLLDREQAIEALHRGSISEIPLLDDNGDDVDATTNSQNTQQRLQQLQQPFKPNTEIRVEALVRMTFRNLFLEGHFFNLPTYTQIDSRQVDEIDGATTSGSSRPLLTPIQEWVQVDVMVKDPSIGLILERLERIGVGSSIGTISIFKAELCRTAAEQVALMGTNNENNTTTTSTRTTPNPSIHGGGGGGGGDEIMDGSQPPQPPQEDPQKKLEAARAEWKNAASRLRVEQVKEQIHEQAKLSLDFLALLTIASILAGIGLIVNSTVVIVASMLVSPIMGPVMGMVRTVSKNATYLPTLPTYKHTANCLVSEMHGLSQFTMHVFELQTLILLTSTCRTYSV
jgi:hypothetical protein